MNSVTDKHTILRNRLCRSQRCLFTQVIRVANIYLILLVRLQLGYFKQRVVAGEVGSSTMPHKVRNLRVAGYPCLTFLSVVLA